MIVLHWWFIATPAWGWHHIAHTGHDFAGLVVFAAAGIAYCAVTLGVTAAAVATLGALRKGFRRGYRKTGPQRPE